jgi:hypothetical protein
MLKRKLFFFSLQGEPQMRSLSSVPARPWDFSPTRYVEGLEGRREIDALAASYHIDPATVFGFAVKFAQKPSAQLTFDPAAARAAALALGTRLSTESEAHV